MIKVRRVVSIVSLAAIATVPLLPSPVSAADCHSEGYRWTLRGVGAKIDSDGDPSVTETADPFERLKFDISSGEAVGAELEYRVNCPVGIAFGLLAGNLHSMVVFDTEFEWLMESDDVDFSLLSLGVNFHLTPRSRADFFIGPFVGAVDYEGVDFDTAGIPLDADLDGDTVIGLNAGLDFPFSDNGPWAFTAGLRYLATSADGPGFSIDVDPLIASVGIAYRWNGKKCGPCVAAMDESAAAMDDAPEAVAPPVAPPPPPVDTESAAAAPPPPAPPPPAPAPPSIVEHEVCHFSTNKARVSNICKAKLDEVALKLKQDPALGARIVGHADSTGNDRINDPLSIRRAEAVKGYLVERHSIDPSRIAIAGVGSHEPAASNDTADGRAQNRRAVVVISLS